VRSPLPIAALVLAVAGCVEAPRTKQDKEVYVEPFREAEYELARLGRLVPFPLAPSEQPRAYSFARAFDGEDERSIRTQMILAGTQDESADIDDPKKRPDLKKIERPPTSLILPERIDVRTGSACYLGHSAFLDRAGTQVIHHVRLHVANRERARVDIPVSSFVVLFDSNDGAAPSPLAFIAATTDRAVKIPTTMDVPPGEERVAHFFYAERTRISPILSVRWTATVQDLRGGPERDVSFRGELVRRYIAKEAPLSPLEERVSRGNLDFPEPMGTRSDWIDPGLSAVPGAGK
jgi:hypothetical protein